ncbi:MAG: ATP-binding protein [Candidatus Dormibacteria bacterium]
MAPARPAGRPRRSLRVFNQLRRSFAAKLVALEVGTIVVVALSVAALLVGSTVLQTRDLEQKASRASAEGLRANLDLAGVNANKLAHSLATFPALEAEFKNPNRARMDALLNAQATLLPRGEALVALDSAGRPLLARGGNGSLSTSDRLDEATFSGIPSTSRFASGNPPAAGVIEMAAGHLRLDATVPVSVGGTKVGYVVDSQDLAAILGRLARPGGGVQYSIFQGGRRLVTTRPGMRTGGAEPAGLSSPDSRGGRFGVYDLGGATYAGYFTPLAQGDNLVAVAEVDDALFAAQRLNDILVVLFATTLLATALSLLGVYFARRTALQPLAALSEGARLVKEGNYGARVAVDSKDDFGRLATTFNEMAGEILSKTETLERQRAHLDASIASLSSVSRALTATTAGQVKLREAVLGAVTEMTGCQAVAMFEGTDRLRVTAARGLDPSEARRLLGLLDRSAPANAGDGVVVRLQGASEAFQGWSMVAVPMVYQERSAGMIAAFGPGSLEGVDMPSLIVLANQAVVALQNSLLFERERETVARLTELDGMKSDFFATIQHELRTPLTAIMGMTDLLEMAWDVWKDEQKKDAVNDVQVSAKLLYEIVETILDYSMLMSDRVQLSVADHGLRGIADAAVEELRPLIRRGDVQIDVRVPMRIKVRGDEQRLNQVMKALIDNAVKFSPEKAKVQVRAEQQNGRVTLKVIDRGIGIAPEHQGQIFDRFFQVDNTATRRYGGTGMGLALVKQVVEMHHGKVSVESTPGKGSTFTLTLPSGGSTPRGRSL